MVLALVMVLAACSSDSQSTTTTDNGQVAAEPIRIGTLLSVTGPLANLGDKMQKGMQLAVDQINAAGGIDGRPIEWIMYDPAGDASVGIEQTRKLISDDQVDLIIGGGTSSGIALGMADITEEAGILFMATEGARQIVMPTEDRKLTFKSTFNDAEIIERTIEFWKDQGVTKVAFLPDTTGFGTSALEVMEELAPPAGIELFVESFETSATDLTPQLSRLSANDPESYFAWTATPTGVVFLKNAQELGLMDDALIQNSFGFVDSRYMVQAGGLNSLTPWFAPRLGPSVVCKPSATEVDDRAPRCRTCEAQLIYPHTLRSGLRRAEPFPPCVMVVRALSNACFGTDEQVRLDG